MRRRRRDRPGEADTLTLPAGDAEPSLADLRIEPMAKVGYLVLERGHADGPPQRGVVAPTVGGIERHVLAQRAGEEHGVLREIADHRAAFPGRQFGGRCAIDQDRPGLDGAYADDRACQRALPGPDWTGHRHQRPGRNVEAETL